VPDRVVIAGGGVIGCSVAYALSRRGFQVTLLDSSYPGRATSASAGGLWPIGESIGLGCGVIYHKAQNGGTDEHAGPEPLPRCFMDFLLTSNDLFPDLASELEDLSGIDIEAESGTGLMYALLSERELGYAERLLELVDSEEHGALRLSAEETRELEPTITTEILGSVYFPSDNQVNPMNLAEALKVAATRLGARFVPETAVTGLEVDGGRIVEVRTPADRYRCDAFVNAAGAWSAELGRMAGIDDLPVYPVRGQIVCTETLQPATLRCNLSTSDCYLLQKAHGEVIIGSTTEHCDFQTDVNLDNIQELARGAVRVVPALRHALVKRTWSGLRPGTPDELPILGPVGAVRGYFNATGAFSTGIVAAPLTGEVVAAYVAGTELPFPAEPFLLERFERELAPSTDGVD